MQWKMWTGERMENKELPKALKDMLKKTGDKVGITYEEMERRLKEFLNATPRSSLSEEELNKQFQNFVKTLPTKKSKMKRGKKVTITLDYKEEELFQALKEKINASSNAEVLRWLIKQNLDKSKSIEESNENEIASISAENNILRTELNKALNVLTRKD